MNIDSFTAESLAPGTLHVGVMQWPFVDRERMNTHSKRVFEETITQGSEIKSIGR